MENQVKSVHFSTKNTEKTLSNPKPSKITTLQQFRIKTISLHCLSKTQVHVEINIKPYKSNIYMHGTSNTSTDRERKVQIHTDAVRHLENGFCSGTE